MQIWREVEDSSWDEDQWQKTHDHHMLIVHSPTNNLIKCMITSNEVYDGSQNQTNDWVHQLDDWWTALFFSSTVAPPALDVYPTFWTWRRPCEQIFLAAALSLRLNWNWPEMPDSVAFLYSPANWEQVTTPETIAALIVGYSVVIAEWRNMIILSSLRVTSLIYVSVNKISQCSGGR